MNLVNIRVLALTLAFIRAVLSGERCLTLTTRSPCQFPFTFNQTMYNSCTTAGHPIGRAWCYTQEEEDQWDFCDVGCPVEAGCPNGWKELQSGCYQDLSVSGGVDVEAAEDICAQYGARLVSSSSLEERQDLVEFYRERGREVAESSCSSSPPGSLAYWLRPEGEERCEVWLADSADSADSSHLLLPGQVTLVRADCNLTQLAGLPLQPLCIKSDQTEQAGGFFLGYLLQSLLSLHRSKARPVPACPPTMKRAGERCLVLSQEILNYQEAREHCHQLGLELISLDTEEEVEEVRGLVKLQQRSGCEDAQGWWVVDNSQPGGHHSLLRMSDCSLAIPQTESEVSDRPETWDCSNTNFTLVSSNNSLTATRHVRPRTVCQLPRQSVEDNEVVTDGVEMEEVIEQVPVSVPVCGGDWTLIGSNCYQTVSLRKTVSRDQAQVICQDRGGDLTEINTEEEHTALVDYYSHTFPLAATFSHLFSSFISSVLPVPRRQKGWWLGGSYEDSSESWTWDSQPETEMNFTNWHPLNTHNNRTENCLVLMDSRTLTWLTLPCSGREDGSLVLQPFCEKTLE